MEKEQRYVIENEDGRYLAAINFGYAKHVDPFLWVFPNSSRAVIFENEEKAKAAIRFIGDCINWELAMSLVISQA